MPPADASGCASYGIIRIGSKYSRLNLDRFVSLLSLYECAIGIRISPVKFGLDDEDGDVRVPGGIL
jgi:hypothetical protein